MAQQSGDEELEDTIQTAMTGLAIGLAKQFTSRSYLLSLNQALEALSDPERQGKVFVGGVAQSMIPFSAATRQLSQDSYLRDARNVTDRMLQVVPGMSETLPPKFNWLGHAPTSYEGNPHDPRPSFLPEVLLAQLHQLTEAGPRVSTQPRHPALR